jgi:hypothetical protein
VVLLTLGGVGGYLWLDHKLTLERRVNSELGKVLMNRAALCSAGEPLLPAMPQLAPPRMLPAPARPGPVARNARSSARVPRLALAPRTYDDIFERRGRGLPVPYLRALALHESDMQPRLSDGPSWGLLQVIEVVREDFNKRERASYTRQDLLDPAINVTIAASAIALIAKSYATYHSTSANMVADWRNPQFVALLTFGWVAGWSERGGVGRVVSYLEQRGIEVTVNAVFDAAKAAGASPHLWNPSKLAWCKQVTRQYFAELADEERVIEIETPPRREPREAQMYVVDVPSAAREAQGPLAVEVPNVQFYADDSSGPITLPSQVEHEPAQVVMVQPTGTVAGMVEHPSQLAPSNIGPDVRTHPSGGDGPIDPYGDGPVQSYGYPEDPYAYPAPVGGDAHA